MVEKTKYVKKILTLLLFFIILLLYFLIFELPRKEKEEEKQKIFHFVHSDVIKFELYKTNSVIEVERILNDWRINKPRELPASKMDVDSFLADVRDLKIEKVVGKNLPDLSIFGLALPRFQLKLYLKKEKGEEALVLKVGNQNPDKSGFYAKLENSPEVYILENFTESILDKDLHYFRDKDIFKIKESEVKIINITYSNENFEISKDEKNIWKLTRPVIKTNLKEEEVNKILIPILDLKSKKFYDECKKISLYEAGINSPFVKIYLTDKKLNKYGILVGKEDKENYGYYAKKIDSEIIFTIDKYIINDMKDILANLKKVEENNSSTNTSVSNK